MKSAFIKWGEKEIKIRLESFQWLDLLDISTPDKNWNFNESCLIFYVKIYQDFVQ